MSYIGGGMYDAEPCPLCGETLWNGQCDNPDCHYHWHPKGDKDDEEVHRLMNERSRNHIRWDWRRSQ